MRVNFRQGIARYQTDVGANATFLQKSPANNAYIDLVVSPDPTIVVFAHKAATYLFEESKTVRNAWGPFTPGGPTFYLYWDMSLLNAAVTRGATRYPPIFSPIPPNTPVVDQHWFDTTATCMKVWDGNRWAEKIRVFAAEYRSSSIIKPFPLGSQAGLNAEVDAGNIVLDIYGKPLRMSDGTFATTTAQLSVVGLATKQIKIEADVLQLLAVQQIPKHYLVRIQEGRKALPASSEDVTSRVAGLAAEDIYQNEVGTIVANGLVRSDSFTWASSQIGKPLFCGVDGELTVVPPTAGVLQQVGTVWDTDAVMINIYPPVVLDDPFSVVPPPVVNPNAPVANFSSLPFLHPTPTSSGSVPFTVQFQDTSTNSPTSLEWDFTNDGTVDSTISNPTYTFAAAGTYTIRLRATNAFGSTEKLQTFVVDSGASAGNNVNLEVTMGGPAQVVRNTTFSINVLVRNEGLDPATNVQRTLIIPNVGNEQITVATYPPGTTLNRVGTLLYINLPVIANLASGAFVNQTLGINAPSLPNTTVVITSSVTSPEADPSQGDNTSSLSILVRP